MSRSSVTTSSTPGLPKETVGYVTAVGSGASIGLGATVIPIDLSTETLGSAIPVGTYPDAVAISEKTNTAYVTNYVSNDITPINLKTGKALRPILAGAGPAGIAIAPDGKTAYVTDAGTAPIGNTVTPIDLVKKKPLAPITVGNGPQGIVVTRDGKMAYVADAGAIVSGQSGAIGSTVTPIDLATRRALSPITVGNAPVALALSPDGSTVYVTNSGSGSVTPIAVGTNSPGTPIHVNGAPDTIALTPDGATAYVGDVGSSSTQAGNLTPITVATGIAGMPIPVGKVPSAVVIAQGGKTAYVVCFGSNSIVPIDLATNSAQAAIAVPGGPYAIALTSAAAGSFRVPKTAPSSAKKPTTKG